MTDNFRASQVETSQIIASGTLANGSGAKMVIYPIDASGSPINHIGSINQTLFNTGSLNGTDIFLYISGAIGGKNSSGRNISVFGGDLHISGNLSLNAVSVLSTSFILSSSVKYNIPTYAQSTYTVLESDYVIPVSSSGVGTTVIINSTQIKPGRELIVKDVGGNASTLNLTISSSFGKIDGSSTYNIAINYGSVTLICFNTSDANNTWGVV